MQTYYFKSECYHELAIKTLEEKYCDSVIEKKSIFLDGFYYSPESCRNKIRTIKEDALVQKVDASSIHHIWKISPIMKDKNLIVNVDLTDSQISGDYALAVTAQYRNYNADVYSSLNPEGASIRYDKGFERFLPLSNWIVHLNSHQQNFIFTIPKKNFVDMEKALSAGEVKLEVGLEFMRSDTGGIADPENDNRNSYRSNNTVSLQP